MNLRDSITHLIHGEAAHDEETLRAYSRDTSIFERTPRMVVFPKDADDVAALVRFVHEEKKCDPSTDLSITARAAGTDMTGGPLGSSISLVFTKHMNHIGEIANDADGQTGYAVAEPGVYYRDFEKETLAKTGKLLPSYPASRELCSIGGMIANNSGGELTLRYGKTARYVRELEVVLSDGSPAVFRPLTLPELELKKKEDSLEGRIHKQLHELVVENWDEIQRTRPSVTKNSSGYALWDVWDREERIFDITKLITGSQGTLALVTKAKLVLVRRKPHRAMLVAFLADIENLPDIVQKILAFSPESLESYDDRSFRLAVRFLPQLIARSGLLTMLKLAIAFIPEGWMTLTGGVPKLVVMAEFAEDSEEEAWEKAKQARESLHGSLTRAKIYRSEVQMAKYWSVRRESFALLRKSLKGRHASPFIDDVVVRPEKMPDFIKELNAMLLEYHLIYTVIGHVGDGNFHVIPLMDLSLEKDRNTIMELTPRVNRLVVKYGGSMSGEHNDGIIRTPYLPYMFSPKMIEIFAKTKKIFDPLDIFNPGKKTGGTVEDIKKYMIRHA